VDFFSPFGDWFIFFDADHETPIFRPEGLNGRGIQGSIEAAIVEACNTVFGVSGRNGEW
jgi:hypothetical protein